ncbi:MAG TPA: MFS transporter [Gammaproteobacteria bacterium]|nr:MFS transporter [Gammaproteobacteria bacterium]
MNIRKLTLFSGHIVECFDNTLYGFFAVMLAPIYFPTGSEQANLLGSYGAFAAGFLARPLGAIFFGLLGDKQGRRKPLLWSMACVGFPTMAIGLLPGYDRIGISATVLLVTCRLLQGFFMGGEFTGVNLCISENDDPKTLGRQTGILIATGGIGAILATILGAYFSMKVMPAWAWRIPFIIGGFSALGIYFLRKNLQETRAFRDAQQQNELVARPWKILFAHHKRDLLLSILIAGLTVMPLYCATIFGNQIFKEIGFTTSQSLLLNALCLTLDAIVIVYFGRLSDKIGFRNHMILSAICTVVVPIPSFMLLNQEGASTFHVLAFISLLTVPGSFICGCAMAYIAKLFPTNCRYSAVAVCVTLGHALLGGTTPLMSTFLKNSFHSTLAPGFWVSFISLLVVALIYTREKRINWSIIEPKSPSAVSLH